MMIEESIFENFSTISLEEMEKVRLMNRIDSKYITNESNLRALLEIISQRYYVQEIESMHNMPYSTLYFDTPDADMFYQHVRGKKTRQKIRTRIYEGSMDIPFLEIKMKNNKGRTRKKRVLMENGEELLTYLDFLTKHTNYEIGSLIPQVRNHFRRVTLVNLEMTERITIDTDIQFQNIVSLQEKKLHNLGIIEWKRDGVSCKSGLENILRSLHIHESGFSKYCMGMALTNPILRHNRLKPKIRLMEKIISRI